MWAAYEEIAELTGIFSSLSSSPLPCDHGFCASLSEADPTAPFTSPGILLLLGLLNPSASPENKVSKRGRFCSQEIAQIQGNPELVERSKTSKIEVPSPVLLVLSSKSKVMSHHARQAPAFVLELKGEQSAFICAAAG